MLYWALVFLVVAIIAGVLGFGGIAGASAGIAQILFFVFLAFLVLSLLAGLFRRAGSGAASKRPGNRSPHAVFSRRRAVAARSLSGGTFPNLMRGTKARSSRFRLGNQGFSDEFSRRTGKRATRRR